MIYLGIYDLFMYQEYIVHYVNKVFGDIHLNNLGK